MHLANDNVKELLASANDIADLVSNPEMVPNFLCAKLPDFDAILKDMYVTTTLALSTHLDQWAVIRPHLMHVSMVRFRTGWSILLCGHLG
jgi:hypothetical protein